MNRLQEQAIMDALTESARMMNLIWLRLGANPLVMTGDATVTRFSMDWVHGRITEQQYQTAIQELLVERPDLRTQNNRMSGG